MRLLESCKDQGLLIGKGGMAGNVLRIKPPLCLNKKDADFIVETLDQSLRQTAKT